MNGVVVIERHDKTSSSPLVEREKNLETQLSAADQEITNLRRRMTELNRENGDLLKAVAYLRTKLESNPLNGGSGRPQQMRVPPPRPPRVPPPAVPNSSSNSSDCSSSSEPVVLGNDGGHSKLNNGGTGGDDNVNGDTGTSSIPSSSGEQSVVNCDTLGGDTGPMSANS